jgi:hypothetical protein
MIRIVEGKRKEIVGKKYEKMKELCDKISKCG